MFRFKGKRHYYYKFGEYIRLSDAIRTAKRMKRKNGGRYKIMEKYVGGNKMYCLYLTNAGRSY